MNEKYDVITVRELAQLLRIGINAAYQLVRDGTIFSVKVGRQYRVPRSSVESYLTQKSNTCA